MATWNPWHGCHKISEGCEYCYVYRQDSAFEKNSNIVSKNKSFDLPIKCTRNGEYKIKSGEMVNTCFTSDFFVEEADEWRLEAFKMIKKRNDLKFFIITKRIHRFMQCIPDDWGDGYNNVCIACTVENQRTADYRLPIYEKVPIKHKGIICAPLLENINLEKYLSSDIEFVSVGGESGLKARVCDYSWVLNIREQCINQHTDFIFHQTGARLIKDDKTYRILRKFQHSQARKSGIDLKY